MKVTKSIAGITPPTIIAAIASPLPRFSRNLLLPYNIATKPRTKPVDINTIAGKPPAETAKNSDARPAMDEM